MQQLLSAAFMAAVLAACGDRGEDRLAAAAPADEQRSAAAPART